MNVNWLWDRKISDAGARKTLKSPDSKGFIMLSALLLSRKNDPHEVFKKYLDPLIFCKQWTLIKKKMRQDKWSEPRIVFWQAVYENMADKYHKKGISFRREISKVKEPLCQNVGKKIDMIRLEQGLSQKELAKKMGVSQQLISRIEMGNENVSLSTLNAIARALDKKIEIGFTA